MVFKALLDLASIYKHAFKTPVCSIRYFQISKDNKQLFEDVKRLLDIIDYDTHYTRVALMEKLERKSKQRFHWNYLHPAIELSLIRMIIPDKPNSRNQRYVKL